MLENTDQQVAKILEAVQAVTPEVAAQSVTCVMIGAVAWVVVTALLMPVCAWALSLCIKQLRKEIKGNDPLCIGAVFSGCAACGCFIISIVQTVCIVQCIYAPQYIATRRMLELFGL